MARARKLPFETTIPPGMVKAVRQRQGAKANRVDDAEAHLVDGPLIATNERERDIHRQWVKDPGEADIQGIDSPAAQITDPKREERRRKEEKKHKPAPPVMPPAKFDPPEPKAKEKPGKPSKHGAPRTKPPALDKNGSWDGYIITGGTAKGRQQIHDTIQNNFTKKELAGSRGLVIDVGSKLRGNVAGLYVDSKGYRTNAAMTKKMAAVEGSLVFMRVDKNYLIGDVITHEFTHHVRANRLRADQKAGRDSNADVTSRQAKMLFKDGDREESATDLETVSRHNNFDRPGPDPSKRTIGRPSTAGYYQLISPGSGRTTSQAELHDRAVITLDGSLDKRKAATGGVTGKNPPAEKLRTSGKKGTPLRKRINERFDDTLMGKSKMGKRNRIDGRIENLDQYFAAVDSEGKTVSRIHVRSPKLTSARKLAKDALGSTPGSGKIVSYDDGKAKVIGSFGRTSKGKFN